MFEFTVKARWYVWGEGVRPGLTAAQWDLIQHTGHMHLTHRGLLFRSSTHRFEVISVLLHLPHKVMFSHLCLQNRSCNSHWCSWLWISPYPNPEERGGWKPFRNPSRLRVKALLDAVALSSVCVRRETHKLTRIRELRETAGLHGKRLSPCTVKPRQGAPCPGRGREVVSLSDPVRGSVDVCCSGDTNCSVCSAPPGKWGRLQQPPPKTSTALPHWISQ